MEYPYPDDLEGLREYHRKIKERNRRLADELAKQLPDDIDDAFEVWHVLAEILGQRNVLRLMKEDLANTPISELPRA